MVKQVIKIVKYAIKIVKDVINMVKVVFKIVKHDVIKIVKYVYLKKGKIRHLKQRKELVSNETRLHKTDTQQTIGKREKFQKEQLAMRSFISIILKES